MSPVLPTRRKSCACIGCAGGLTSTSHGTSQDFVGDGVNRRAWGGSRLRRRDRRWPAAPRSWRSANLPDRRDHRRIGVYQSKLAIFHKTTMRLRRRPSYPVVKSWLRHRDVPADSAIVHSSDWRSITTDFRRYVAASSRRHGATGDRTIDALNVSRRFGGRQPSWLRIWVIAA